MSRKWSAPRSRSKTRPQPHPAAAATPSACDPAAMKVATWNVNSVRKRTGNLVAWLGRAKPDVAVLQAHKEQEAQFPRLDVEAAGYKVEIVDQKGFNGVALLSLHPVEITARSLPDAVAEEPGRYTERRIASAHGPPTPGGT